MTWLQLANKTAIVTGAGSGIGAAVSKMLVSQNCRVVMADLHIEAMEKVANEFKAAETQTIKTIDDMFRPVQCNVAKVDDVQNLIRVAEGANILVNCAGITRDNWTSKMSVEDWDNVIDINLKGTFLTCQAFLKDMSKNDSSVSARESIINVGSIVSEIGNLGQANYGASKGGVLGITRCLAKEMAQFGVRVNAVVPGFIETPMAQAVPDHVKERIIPKIPLGRFGKPDEVANLIAFLASSRSSYITGECIRVSGMISL